MTYQEIIREMSKSPSYSEGVEIGLQHLRKYYGWSLSAHTFLTRCGHTRDVYYLLKDIIKQLPYSKRKGCDE